MDYDAVIVGGGHNGLVAAAYLAGAGRSVLVLERRGGIGGAAVSARPFAGVDVRLSRYSYLVGLLPRRIIADLGLDVRLRRRRMSSYTPGRRNRSPCRHRGRGAHRRVVPYGHRVHKGLRGLAKVLRAGRTGRRGDFRQSHRAIAFPYGAAIADWRRRGMGDVLRAAGTRTATRAWKAKTPLDLETELGLPRGHIFHRDLSWPYGEAGTWGVETAHERVLLCGAGAMRGGGVSGIPGHNAAMAVLGRRFGAGRAG
ncbi:NAD(P)-binding protein [Amycolatopsis panacis]|uniref:NAD(P)-binding protein n=1 Tax=Amycolatopsis panacis TaxID=2340917 RepID=UPI002277E452